MLHSHLSSAGSLATIRDRIHKKAGSYFTFESHRSDREKHLTIFGATDALLDAGDAGRAYSEAITGKSDVNLLACYGFLQALFVQQDAVWNLSKLLNLDWSPWGDDKLSHIRNVRNQLCGHPAKSGEKGENFKKKSARSQNASNVASLASAIIPKHSISKLGFRGAIYFENKFESVEIVAGSMLAENEERLAQQLRVIERQMDHAEKAFREARNRNFESILLSPKFDYILKKAWCCLSNEDAEIGAESHIKMIRDAVANLKQEFSQREILPWWPGTRETKIGVGLAMLEGTLFKEREQNDQHAFDITYDGTAKAVEELRSSARSILESLRSEME